MPHVLISAPRHLWVNTGTGRLREVGKVHHGVLYSFTQQLSPQQSKETGWGLERVQRQRGSTPNHCAFFSTDCKWKAAFCRKRKGTETALTVKWFQYLPWSCYPRALWTPRPWHYHSVLYLSCTSGFCFIQGYMCNAYWHIHTHALNDI